MEYALKDGADHPLRPHVEWLCTRLAGAVGIVCPPCAIVEDENGNYLFGSRWEGGVARDNWWDMVDRGDIEIATFAPLLSRILAFDLFVHNVDRHLNNYLIRKARNIWTVMAFDFSRAWTCNGELLPPLPIPPHENTIVAYRELVGLFGPFLVQEAADEILDRLAEINTQRIADINAEQPRQWLPDRTADEVLQWWASASRTDRIGAIKEGMRDGSYL